MGGHKGGPYIFCDSALENYKPFIHHQHYRTIEPCILILIFIQAVLFSQPEFWLNYPNYY